MSRARRWSPPVILLSGCLLLLLARRQNPVELVGPLTSLPRSFAGYQGSDTLMSEAERRVAGMDDYLLRLYTRDSTSRFSVYVGYYTSQLQGRSIHSPKNCLPGSGWEPVDVGVAFLAGPTGPVTVNRYVLEQSQARALVYYWYQGRGRVAYDEYRVKWDLLRDKALFGRSEEALVRIVVPLGGGEGAMARADSLATQVGGRLITDVTALLPAPPLA